MKMNISYDMIDTSPNYLSTEDLGLVLVYLKNGKTYSATPDIFSSITHKYYIQCLVGVSSVNINIHDIEYSDNVVFNNMILNFKRKLKFIKLI